MLLFLVLKPLFLEIISLPLKVQISTGKLIDVM